MEVEVKPFEDMARDLTITSLDCLRECLLTQDVFSDEYNLYKGFIIQGLSFLEAKQFEKNREGQPVHDTYIPTQE